MEDSTMVEEEDSKQFDSVNGGNEEDNQPDPDEPLMMDAGNGRVWLVKVRIHPRLHVPQAPNPAPAQIPRHLMERWSQQSRSYHIISPELGIAASPVDEACNGSSGF